MEYSQTTLKTTMNLRLSGLNPYSNGILTNYMYDYENERREVLILILMEYSQTSQSHTWDYGNTRLNPYSNGILTNNT